MRILISGASVAGPGQPGVTGPKWMDVVTGPAHMPSTRCRTSSLARRSADEPLATIRPSTSR
jgi:hypothetical protein